MKIPGILRPSKKKILLLIILLIAGFFILNTFGQKKQTPLQFAEVKKQDIKSTVSSSGSLTGKDSVSLKFKSSGKLSYVNVKTGDTVSTGQVIAGLDTQGLAITLQQAQNTLRDKQAIAQKAEDDVKDHSSDESFAQKVTRTTAQAARDSAFDNVKAAQRAFQDAVIISPLDGIVTQAIETVGQSVSGTDLIVQIVDNSAVYFDTDIDEADISKLSEGQPAEVILDAYPDKIFKGSVEQILPQTKSTSTGATVITARIKLDESKMEFINGLNGQASVILSEQKNVLTIPQEALREDNTVLIQTPDGVRSQKVVPGIRSDTDVEIKEGLKEEDRVVLNPPAQGIPNNRARNPLQGILRIGGGGRR
ncbi:MAG: Efflux transporter, RND family, MFP subunit [Candidatus Daviesbacteria bacterium GW2011_GWB1_39_5]|uniref:Efflux transporter, RND family, MFP subunit n=1 Tax=Candidatus Daviesbacteria bacterium GW2011_GWC2_40_12 TaxID=1618431 RepID=A0A0G0T5K0_9BACT|nr:MAG: Efflux transporter, RND family, MFP subunit [Candidatus Daviesbacteria bacterium GW2011_GWF2_38_7]KKR16803.1 MAG: Efflux transporter, RND family, MFP subunit [Candidatus Daviesbacteria bacterium GW2011_GWA2_39_33]KKR24633.1 MAG: Efflux transporter, RND family, MFP subunit [Candidatus Daviesbacteria bacterium GW2011_GWB1_39_5]KKR42415.1 MAG: Efflux transporter, RND family, MFP subunit [Candidatus Daviesbacteria bacterium GW2011_GWC2_40_12]OGE22328.1 MAG: hypothetical protein A2778_00580 